MARATPSVPKRTTSSRRTSCRRAGLIFDRNGTPLVENTPVYTATIVPDLLPESSDTRYAIYNKLESIIGVPALEIQTPDR